MSRALLEWARTSPAAEVEDLPLGSALNRVDGTRYSALKVVGFHCRPFDIEQ
jgi:hypothetical protein